MTITVAEISRGQETVRGLLASSQSSTNGHALLLCRPIGLEAIRTASLYRAVADSSLRIGCESLRFDYVGTGDSGVPSAGVCLTDFVLDTVAAIEWLVQERHASTVHLFGVGLGAVVAVRAALSAWPRPHSLVLCDPIVDGQAYMRRLLDAHRAEVSFGLGLPWATLLSKRRAIQPQFPGWVLGFDYGDNLARDIQGLTGEELLMSRRRGVRIGIAANAGCAEVVRALALDSIQIECLGEETDWMRSWGDGGPLVPPKVLQLVRDFLSK